MDLENGDSEIVNKHENKKMQNVEEKKLEMEETMQNVELKEWIDDVWGEIVAKIKSIHEILLILEYQREEIVEKERELYKQRNELSREETKIQFKRLHAQEEFVNDQIDKGIKRIDKLKDKLHRLEKETI